MIDNSYTNKISKMRGKQELLIEKSKSLSTEFKNLEKGIITLEQAQAFIQQVAKDTQEQIKFMIADIVNLALDTCFPDQYEFTVNFVIKRGKTEAELFFMKQGIEIDPLGASGGGVVDLASFALRIAIWSLGKSDNVIVLDEPLKWLQPKELNKKGFEIIKRLSNKLNLQFIINSNTVNSGDLCEIADKIFEVKLVNDVSKVIERNM